VFLRARWSPSGILRVMILSQLAPHRLIVAPEAPIPLAGLLEEVAAAQAAADGQGLLESGALSESGHNDGSSPGSYVMREPSISAAAGPAELGWEELPSSLAADVEQEVVGIKEVSSLQVGWRGRKLNDRGIGQGGMLDSSGWL